MEDDLSVDNDIHQKDVPTHASAGGCDTHEGSEVGSCHCHASCDRIAFGDLLIDFVSEVWKRSSHHGMAFKNLLESGMFREACEVVAIEGLEEPEHHRLVLYRSHGCCARHEWQGGSSLWPPVLLLGFRLAEEQNIGSVRAGHRDIVEPILVDITDREPVRRAISITKLNR
jgi:hypothetical protein